MMVRLLLICSESAQWTGQLHWGALEAWIPRPSICNIPTSGWWHDGILLRMIITWLKGCDDDWNKFELVGKLIRIRKYQWLSYIAYVAKAWMLERTCVNLIESKGAKKPREISDSKKSNINSTHTQLVNVWTAITHGPKILMVVRPINMLWVHSRNITSSTMCYISVRRLLGYWLWLSPSVASAAYAPLREYAGSNFFDGWDYYGFHDNTTWGTYHQSNFFCHTYTDILRII